METSCQMTYGEMKARELGNKEGYDEGYGECASDMKDKIEELQRKIEGLEKENVASSKIHWITRVDDGENFWNSDRYSVWGISDTVHGVVQSEISPVKTGDIIWFVKNKPNGGNIVAFATFHKVIQRDVDDDGDDDDCKVSKLTNEDFKWKETGWKSNYLLKYKSRVNIEIEETIQLDLMGANPMRQSTAEKTSNMLKRMNVDLDEIYQKYI